MFSSNFMKTLKSYLQEFGRHFWSGMVRQRKSREGSSNIQIHLKLELIQVINTVNNIYRPQQS